MSRKMSQSDQVLAARIRPLQVAKWQADYPWYRLESSIAEMGEDFGGLELVPDFQRGHVWTPEQQSHFIENCLRGVIASDGYLLQFNCPNFDIERSGDLPAGLQCLDGLQRYTSVVRFVRGEITAFGYSASDLARSMFCPRRLRMKVAIHTFQWRADLLEHYLAINAGGTPHSASEIDRVRQLLADSTSVVRV